MSIPAVKDFFNNKVNIQLKSGQRFEGLLSHIDYKSNTVTLEDVQDLGNDQDKQFIPHDKKIPEKAFQCENISQIFFKEKHFSEPKKYKKEEFWDAISEPQSQPQKKYKPKYEEGRNDYKKNRNYDNRPKRQNYQQREHYNNYKGPKQEKSENDRDLR